MKRALILTAVLVGAGMGVVVPSPAHCRWCSTLPCLNSSACGGKGCVCAKYGMDLWGQCLSVDVKGGDQ